MALEVSLQGGTRTFTARRLLVDTSRRPNTQDIGLERVGVALDAAVQDTCDNSQENEVNLQECMQISFPDGHSQGDEERKTPANEKQDACNENEPTYGSLTANLYNRVP